MAIFSKLARSSELVKGMADRTGLDLNDPANARQFKQMTVACAQCCDPDGCAKLQEKHATLDKPPAFCRNYARFAAE